MKRRFDAIGFLGAAQLNAVDEIDFMIRRDEYEQKSSHQRKRRRVVRFNEQCNEEHAVVVDDNTWLTREEHHQIRGGVARDVRAVANSPLQAKTLLDKTIYTSIEGDDDEFPQLARWTESPEAILENLTQWARYVDQGRGLESPINGNLRKARGTTDHAPFEQFWSDRQLLENRGTAWMHGSFLAMFQGSTVSWQDSMLFSWEEQTKMQLKMFSCKAWLVSAAALPVSEERATMNRMLWYHLLPGTTAMNALHFVGDTPTT